MSNSDFEIAFHILREAAKKNAYLPVKLAEISYKHPNEALQLLRDWGEGKKPINVLLEKAIELSDIEQLD